MGAAANWVYVIANLQIFLTWYYETLVMEDTRLKDILGIVLSVGESVLKRSLVIKVVAACAFTFIRALVFIGLLNYYNMERQRLQIKNTYIDKEGLGLRLELSLIVLLKACCQNLSGAAADEEPSVFGEDKSRRARRSHKLSTKQTSLRRTKDEAIT